MVYAVDGTLRDDEPESLLTMLTVPRPQLAVEDLMAESPLSHESINTETVANVAANAMVTTPMEIRVAANDAPAALQIAGLINLNPMVQDDKDITGYRDAVAQKAMEDFHDLIIYFMDEDLRKTFVRQTVPALSEAIRQVAEDDKGTGKNREFYQKLQVPYIVSMLAQGISGLRQEMFHHTDFAIRYSGACRSV